MADYEVLYPGRFMKKETLAVPKVVRIVGIRSLMLEGDKGEESKAVVSYKAADGDGEIVWCKTNAALTAAILGTRDYEKWVGHLLTLHHDPSVMFGGKKVGGVRVMGSPELTAPKKVEIKRPRRKKPEVYELVPTDMKGKPKTVTAPEAPAITDADMPVFEDAPDVVNGETA